MSDTVSGEAAIKLAHTAYDHGRRSALAEPQRLRVQAARGVPVDITVHGAVTASVLKNTARLLLAQAEVLEAEPEAALSSASQSDLAKPGSEQVEDDGSRDQVKPPPRTETKT